MKPIIAFFSTHPFEREFFDQANLQHQFDIRYYQHHLSEATAGLAKGHHVACVFVNDQINDKVISVLSEQGVKLLALRSAGYNHVDFKSAYQKVHVLRVPAYSPYAVAEHAVALMLTLNRKIHKAYNRVRENNFALQGLLGFDLHGKTAGVIGTGKIGNVLIKILQGFGMKVLGHDKYQNTPQSEQFAYVDLDTIYAHSDVIFLTCPLTPETHYLINQDSIRKMKEGVMIINPGRGKLIKTSDLIKGLKSKKIGAAGLDVYEEEEQYFFEDHSEEVLDDDVLARLISFNNVIITAHQGFFTREALQSIAQTTLQNIADFFNGGPLLNEICYHCSGGQCFHKENGRCF
jgi:D-lactate dehydrogenase